MATIREEDYLETIASISREKGYAKVKDVSKALSVAPSSVTEMLKRLSEEGYVNYVPYSGVTLTSAGEKLAAKVQARHDTIKEFFMLLGMEEARAEEDACKVEHAVEPDTMDRLSSFVRHLNRPEVKKCCLKDFLSGYDDG
ncbi:MAG: metal-dependent transcriptional regulator [Candidatus Thermoplasmatota archaeon]|nr:metal-dependent transcriptional regulator [Candidatus Thermoplasmatota archaeon]